jgi:hypothetical protein
MYYEINISVGGKHFFATAERSIPTRDDMIKLYKIMKEKFPESEGYHVEVSEWRNQGRILHLENKNDDEIKEYLRSISRKCRK